MSIFTKSKNSFEGQLPEEETILLTRKHWLILLFPLASIIFTAIIILGIYFVINSASWYPMISSLYFFLISVSLLVLWTLGFYSIMIYDLNTVIVTNKRIIQNKQKGLFKHSINELELEKIQDISVSISGPLEELLHFGSIEVQSAGAKNKFHFHQLPCPEEIKDKIIITKNKK